MDPPAWVCSTTFDFYAKYSVDSSAEAQASGRYTHVSICSFVGPGVSATTTAPTPATPAPKGTVTKRVKAGVKLNVRTAPSTTASLVGKLAAGTAVTGTLSCGWMKITTGTYAGRFVSATYLV
ncbi:SH3 domain-containing protein [Dermacoccus abyssi]|uniref:SH3 domain-containing protein n=1 Tax=Dermacoccus abyssi TaxID=322596 RepID=UPI0021A3C377|nr:SH3 domain-containing protein [Dermacoccus abyssi]MCT1985993.1 SH3 domain-containing protein [Dermacoccus abyssi]